MYDLRYWSIVFFFNDTATTEIYTLSLHDALPILRVPGAAVRRAHAIPDKLPLSDGAGDVVRHHHRRAGRGLLRHLRLEPAVVGGPDGHSDRHLHHDWRRAGGDLGGRKADGAHRLRADRRGGDPPGTTPHRARSRAGPGGRGGGGPP